MRENRNNIVYIVLTIIGLCAYCLNSTSCANTKGAPTGGPKDTIPPYIVKLTPDSNSLNFPRTKGEIVITFNEYVVLKDPSKNIILSPPQSKRPKTKIKGKSIVVTFEEELDSATTYNINFGNSIVDNNEGNQFPYFTYTFSTGNTIDSMLLSGNVYNYQTLQPIEGANVGLYIDAKDSTVFNTLPNAVTRTDKWGYFVLRNLKNVPYSLYVIKDENNNNKYDPGVEDIGFYDTLVTPSVVMSPGLPQLTVKDMKDTAACLSRPSEVEVLLFREIPSKQFIKEYKRLSERESFIKFGAPNVQIDSFSIRGIRSARVIKQFNDSKDSLSFWIKDGTTIEDTLLLGIKYLKADSLNNLVPTTENLKFVLPKSYKIKKEEKEKESRKMNKNSGRSERKLLLKFEHDATPDKVEQNGVIFTFQDPMTVVNMDTISFSYKDPKQQSFNLDFTMEMDSTNLKRYIFTPAEQFKKGNEYLISIPEKSFVDISGNYNDSTDIKISLPNDDKLSSITAKFVNVDTRYIVELVNETRNNIYRQYIITTDSSLVFPYLKEGSYSFKITQDLNANGKLDIGNVLEKRQPEKAKIYKLPSGEEIIKLKERMDIEQTIDIKDLFNVK